MTEQRSCKEVEIAAARLINAQSGGQSDALEQLARAILEHHDHAYDSTAASELFSSELPMEIQRLAAVWLVRVLTKSSMALAFRNTEGRAGSLFDRVFERDVYREINIDSRTQPFRKLPALADHLQSILGDADGLIQRDLDLRQLNSLQQSLMRLFNGRTPGPFLTVLLSPSLTHRSRLNSLFSAVRNYGNNEDADPMHLYESACDVCDGFESKARAYGTMDADRILGGLARRLKSAVTSHFHSLEVSKSPKITFSPIAKKYPLERPGAEIVFKIRIANDGIGPARELKLEGVDSDKCLKVRTGSFELGTIQAGGTFVLDIAATVVAPSDRADLLVQLSWAIPGGRVAEETVFAIEAQRADVDWESIDLEEPYSTEPVTSGSDLIGRKQELRRLLRLANLQTVGSGFIYGQKRVGKTSLANAVAESLESSTQANWLVISRSSGDYYSVGASNMLRSLGDILFNAMTEGIPGLEDEPAPDFTDGLAPLSRLIDKALKTNDMRILFIIDEFDELPLEFLEKTPQSAALYLPLRQVSSKRGCGILLVGGENMQQVLINHGDHLNKFTEVELDYFERSSDWSDFAELIRKPVQHWLTISDAALDRLFEFSAGNPYFAKLLAAQLFSDMVGNRYSYASEVDMETANDNAWKSVGENSFAHFWTDGLVGSSENTEKERVIRRSILIAAGRALRNCSPDRYAVRREEIWAEFREVFGRLAEEHSFQVTLTDFLRRKVFVTDSSGNISPEIPLFRSWLVNKGVEELLATTRELEHVRSRLDREEEVRVKDTEITELDYFRYQGRAIEWSAIRKWLDQFDSAEDQRLMFKLLSRVRFYSEDSVRAKMHEAFGIVRRNIRTVVNPRARRRRDILVSSLDDSAAKSGLTYCKLFADENGIADRCVQPLGGLSRRFGENHQIQRLVLIDDFSGTGRTLEGGLKKNLALLQRANVEGVRIVLIAVVGFAQARDRIERFMEQSGLEADVHFCDSLGAEDQAFSEQSAIFPDRSEREAAKQVAEAKGVMLVGKNSLGYGGTQATVVFYQSCPNNTLPVFWSEKNGWSPLFPR